MYGTDIDTATLTDADFKIGIWLKSHKVKKMGIRSNEFQARSRFKENPYLIKVDQVMCFPGVKK